jgi:hypothetical protein
MKKIEVKILNAFLSLKMIFFDPENGGNGNSG